MSTLSVHDLAEFTELKIMCRICNGIKKIVDDACESGVITPGSAAPCISLIGHVGEYMLTLDEEQGVIICPIYLSFAYSYFQHELAYNRNVFDAKGHQYVLVIYKVVLAYILMTKEDDVLYRDITIPVTRLLTLVPECVPLQPNLLYTCYTQALKSGFANDVNLINHLIKISTNKSKGITPIKIFSTCLLCSIYSSTPNKKDKFWNKVESVMLHVACLILNYYIQKESKTKYSETQIEKNLELDRMRMLRVVRYILQSLNGDTIIHHIKLANYDFMLSIADVINKQLPKKGKQIGSLIQLTELFVIFFAITAKPFETKVSYDEGYTEIYYISDLHVFLNKLITGCPSIPDLLHWLLSYSTSAMSEITALVIEVIVKAIHLTKEEIRDLKIPYYIKKKLLYESSNNNSLLKNLEEEHISKTISNLQISTLFSSSNLDLFPDPSEVKKLKRILDSHK